MILIKGNQTLTIENSNSKLKLSGLVTFEDNEIKLNSHIYSLEGDHIGVGAYNYRQGGRCVKSIGDTLKQHIKDIEEILEESIEFLIQYFEMSQS